LRNATDVGVLTIESSEMPVLRCGSGKCRGCQPRQRT